MNAYLLVDGSRTAPHVFDESQMLFRLEMPAREIRLISGFARPADVAGSTDVRRLGVGVRELRWQQGDSVIKVPIESPAFIDGFYHVERQETQRYSFRWTNGDAALPPRLFPPWRGTTLLHLNLESWAGCTSLAPLRPGVALLNEFESLGENCEFALAQRHFGIELPLSLLRWSGIGYDKLLRGLECRFQGLGDTGTTKLTWDGTDYRLETEYLRMHTTTIEQCDAQGEAEVLRCGDATLRLLRRKLLRDIADARRIFVFRTADPHVRQPEMHRLHAALRAIGPASLLCVTLKEPGHSVPMVKRLAEGLYAGCLERFVIPDGPFDEWLALCAKTLALHRAC